MNLVIQNHSSYDTSGKTTYRESFVNDSTVGIPSPYAAMFFHINRNNYRNLKKEDSTELDSSNFKKESADDLYQKQISNYLTAFEIENMVIDPEKVAKFLILNKPVFNKLLKTVEAALSEYGNIIESVSLRLLKENDGQHEYLSTSFYMDELVSTRESIDIEDTFRKTNQLVTYDNKLTLAFV